MLLLEEGADLKGLCRQLAQDPDPMRRAEALAELRARIADERCKPLSDSELCDLTMAESIFDFIESYVPKA